MITVIFSRKSGPGKTTLACSMAADLNNRWQKVCIVDADPQQSSYRWGERRAREYIEEDVIKVYGMTGDLEAELIKLSSLYDYIIVDCAGRDSLEMRSALCVADLAIMLTLPSFLDREHYEFISSVIKDFKKENPKLKVKSVISHVTPADIKAGEVARTKKELKKYNLNPLSRVINSEVDYKQTMELGLGGSEVDTTKTANAFKIVIREVLSI